MWVLIFICLNGAQGCTYSTGSTLIGNPSGDFVVAFPDRDSCQKEADVFNERYDDRGIFEVCREVK